MQNFLSRFISAILFIPFILVPIFFGGYILATCYLFLLSLMVFEILNMIKIAKTKIFLYLYLSISILTIFVFIIVISSISNLNLRIIEMIMTIWIFDTFSYLGGKILNGKKLMPKISKGKTINGLLSGTIATLIFLSIYYLEFYNNFILVIILTIPIIIFSFFGDFVVSVLKRSINIKDSGFIMPGHGGIVDRMDSFIMVFFFYGIYLLIFI